MSEEREGGLRGTAGQGCEGVCTHRSCSGLQGCSKCFIMIQGPPMMCEDGWISDVEARRTCAGQARQHSGCHAQGVRS